MGLQMAALPAVNNYVAVTQTPTTNTPNKPTHTVIAAIACTVRKLNSAISATSSIATLLLLVLLTWNPTTTVGVDAVREYKFSIFHKLILYTIGICTGASSIHIYTIFVYIYIYVCVQFLQFLYAVIALLFA